MSLIQILFYYVVLCGFVSETMSLCHYKLDEALFPSIHPIPAE